MNTFLDIVNAILENNKINNAQWKDWQSVDDIINTYGKINTLEWGIAYHFLKALIRDNGDNLDVYVAAMDCLNYSLPLKSTIPLMELHTFTLLNFGWQCCIC